MLVRKARSLATSPRFTYAGGYKKVYSRRSDATLSLPLSVAKGSAWQMCGFLLPQEWRVPKIKNRESNYEQWTMNNERTTSSESKVNVIFCRKMGILIVFWGFLGIIRHELRRVRKG